MSESTLQQVECLVCGEECLAPAGAPALCGTHCDCPSCGRLHRVAPVWVPGVRLDSRFHRTERVAVCAGCASRCTGDHNGWEFVAPTGHHFEQDRVVAVSEDDRPHYVDAEGRRSPCADWEGHEEWEAVR